MSLVIKKIVNKPIDSNCYIILDKEKSAECIIVDPGSKDNDELLKEIERLSVQPKYIILTHEHYDHCWGVNQLRDLFQDVKLVCSRICSEAIQKEKANYSYYFQYPGFKIEPAEIILDDIGWNMSWNDYQFTFSPAQGHTSSGIFIKVENMLYTGDTIIKDYVTVTKSKTGSIEELIKSLNYLNSLKGNDLLICAGHGDCFLLDEYDLTRALKKE